MRYPNWGIARNQLIRQGYGRRVSESSSDSARLAQNKGPLELNNHYGM